MGKIKNEYTFKDIRTYFMDYLGFRLEFNGKYIYMYDDDFDSKDYVARFEVSEEDVILKNPLKNTIFEFNAILSSFIKYYIDVYHNLDYEDVLDDMNN